MSKEPYFPLYVGDYFADTRHLTIEQHGAYLLLLMTMWRHDGSLPNEEKKLARICSVSVKKFRAIWDEISELFDVTDQKISHKRLIIERQKARTLREKRASAGAKGGAHKSLENNDPPQANAKAKQKQIIPGIKKEKELTKVSSKKKAENRGSRLPEYWQPPPEFVHWPMSHLGWPEHQVRIELDKFKDFWISKTGQSATKRDWYATWRNWCRNARVPNQTSSKPKEPTLAEMAAERWGLNKPNGGDANGQGQEFDGTVLQLPGS